MRHLLWEIAEGDGYEKLKQIAAKPLTGLKIAPFYGCQILRPSASCSASRIPTGRSRWSGSSRPAARSRSTTRRRSRCCGFPIVLAREEVALGELIQPLAEAKEAGADAMVTPCPLCHLSLDAWQGKASREADIEFDLPIFHLAQLVGAAAGLTYDELLFKRHVVKADPVADKIYAER